MASLLPPMPVPKRNPRRVAHGGLGGCVQTGQQDRFYETYNRKMSLSRRPLRGKKVPLAVNTDVENRDIALSTMTPTSVVLHDDSSYGEFGNPFVDQMKAPPADGNSVELVSPIEQHESGTHSPVFVNRPQTPPTPEQTATLPVELPGSILLPSQGFPQTNPPIAPARDHFKTFACDESRRSSTPSLDYSSSTTDSDMDMLKNLTSPSKRAGRANTFDAPQGIKASKPIPAMSADELMKCLPELNMSIISHSWVPAMENELKRIKALLQEAAEVQVQNQADLGNFGSRIRIL
ncbi:hypothetical protein GJ744_004814 [Endocarpon pusillum]|uniref:Uncharacterized protein n=1 Tax=Endocarpon pusillum TaxID=364733 RepID=A0A8H7A8H3_9EURO|nr:hypothetical protein GJ744_004814 [Endocarpon pusillum]